MKFHIYNQQKALSLSKLSVQKVLRALYSFLHVSSDELSIYFVTDRKIVQLHKKFFNDPTPTDCITFPMDPPQLQTNPFSVLMPRAGLGDLFVCPAAALRYAAENPYQELLLYLVHGSLHLLGYDDLHPKQRRQMRKMEKKCMDHLNRLNLHILPTHHKGVR